MDRASRLLALATLIALPACEDTELDVLPSGVGEVPNTLDFGVVYVGAVIRRAITLKSTGRGPLVVESIAIAGLGFSVSAIEEPIVAGGSKNLEVAVRPEAPGELIGLLELRTDAHDDPSFVRLVADALPQKTCDDDNGCTHDHFDVSAGYCVFAPHEDACDDHNICTEDDRCTRGRCAGKAVDCDDDVDCTRDSCSRTLGCVNEPRDSRCTDDDPCTIDRCDAEDDCEHPTAPNGTLCGTVVPCITAEVCVLGLCIEADIPEGAPCDDRDLCTINDQCTNHLCDGVGLIRPPELLAETTMVHAPSSATFDRDFLFVSAPVDGRPRFKLMRFDNVVAAPIASFPELDGSAHLVMIDAATHARVVTSSIGERFVDVIRTAAPERTHSTAHIRAGYLNHDDDTAAFEGTRLYFCAAPSPNAEAQLASIDFNDPRQPLALSFHGTSACAEPRDGASAHHDSWVSWKNVGAESTAEVFYLGATTPSSTASVTVAGEIRSARTDGRRAVFDLEDDQTFIVWDLDQIPPRHVYVELNESPPLLLLGVSNRTGIFAQGDRLVEYTLNTIDAPERQRETATVDGVLHADALLAVDETRLAIVAGERLRVYERRFNGIVDTFLLRGLGTITDVRANVNGVLGLSAKSAIWMEAPALSAAALSGLPSEAPIEISGPVLVDGPHESAGVFVAGDRVPLLEDLDRLRVDISGTATIAPRTSSSGSTTMVLGAIDSCIGAGIGIEPLPDWFVVLDRCRFPGAIVDVASFPTNAPSGFSAWEQVVVHDGGWATLSSRDFVQLIDLRAPLAPIAGPERFLDVGPSEGLIGSACDGGEFWALVWIDGTGAVRTRVIEIRTGFEISNGSFERSRGIPVRNTFVLEWPFLYFGAERDADAILQVYAVDRPEASLAYELELNTRLVDLVSLGGDLWAAREDGISLLQRACGP